MSAINSAEIKKLQQNQKLDGTKSQATAYQDSVDKEIAKGTSLFTVAAQQKPTYSTATMSEDKSKTTSPNSAGATTIPANTTSSDSPKVSNPFSGSKTEKANPFSSSTGGSDLRTKYNATSSSSPTKSTNTTELRGGQAKAASAQDAARGASANADKETTKGKATTDSLGNQKESLEAQTASTSAKTKQAIGNIKSDTVKVQSLNNKSQALGSEIQDLKSEVESLGGEAAGKKGAHTLDIGEPDKAGAKGVAGEQKSGGLLASGSNTNANSALPEDGETDENQEKINQLNSKIESKSEEQKDVSKQAENKTKQGASRANVALNAIKSNQKGAESAKSNGNSGVATAGVMAGVAATGFTVAGMTHGTASSLAAGTYTAPLAPPTEAEAIATDASATGTQAGSVALNGVSNGTIQAANTGAQTAGANAVQLTHAAQPLATGGASAASGAGSAAGAGAAASGSGTMASIQTGAQVVSAGTGLASVAQTQKSGGAEEKEKSSLGGDTALRKFLARSGNKNSKIKIAK